MRAVIFKSNKELTLFPHPYLLGQGNVQGLHFHPFTLVTYAICHWFGFIVYVIFSCLSICNHIGLVMKWHFGHNDGSLIETYHMNLVRTSNKIKNPLMWL